MHGKVMALAEAVALVPNGSHLSLGGFTTQRHPMAFVYEMIRQEKKDLHLYGHSPGGDWDLLIGAGCVQRVELAYEADEAFGNIGPRFRLAVQRGELEWEDYSNFSMVLRFAAAAMGLPFLPTRTLLGSSLLTRQGFPPDVRESDPRIARKKLAVMDCPFSGDRVVLVPPARPEITVLHVQEAASDGTCRIYGQSFADAEQALAAERVIVTCERLVKPGELRAVAECNLLPHFRVDAVVHVPYGAHPCACYRYYDYDATQLRLYHSLAEDDCRFRGYLEEFVYGVRNHEEYLDCIGSKRLREIAADPEAGYSTSLRRMAT